MSRERVQFCPMALLVGLAMLVVPASGTTLIRAGLEELVTSHSRIVVVEVAGARVIGSR